MIFAAIAAARGIYFAALMLLFGAAAFGALLKKRLPIVAPAAWPYRWILLVALVSASAWFILAAQQMAGIASLDAIGLAATATLFGNLFMVRIILLLGLLFVPARRQILTALPAAAALILPGATSHAAGASPAGFAAIGAILDAAHLLACGYWLGGLAILAVLFRRKEPNMTLVLSLFSDTAMVAVLLLIMTGLINAATILLGKTAPQPIYLAVLGAKLALVGIMLALALVNRFKWMPANGRSKISRNAATELRLGVIAVLLAGALGQLAPRL